MVSYGTMENLSRVANSMSGKGTTSLCEFESVHIIYYQDYINILYLYTDQ